MREATGKPRSELIALADLIAQDLAHGGKGEIDLKAADKISAGASTAQEKVNFNAFLAGYLDLHGKKATPSAIGGVAWAIPRACTS